MTRNILNRCWILSLLWLAASCSKNEEPPKTVGQSIPYTQITNRSLLQLIDSIPNVRIYDSIYHHSDLGHQIDSLKAVGASPLYTLFAPTDDAFQKAGISLNQVAGYSPALLDSIVFYLACPQALTTEAMSAFQGFTPVNTLLQVSTIVSSYQGEFWNPGNGYTASNPYIYFLCAGWTNGSLMLNGVPVTSAGTNGISGTDGVLWITDTVLTKPTQEAYAIIANDTAYSLYMAACRINDSVYSANYVSFSSPVYTSCPDTVNLQMMQGLAPRTFFVPSNNAFRKAGMFTYTDVTNYIDTSSTVIAGWFYDQNYNVIPTNMDSIIFKHSSAGMFYTQDILADPSLDKYVENTGGNGTFLGLLFSNNNGQVVIHRQDFPNGRAATVIAPHDITTFNGVVHTVDNLLLPTP